VNSQEQDKKKGANGALFCFYPLGLSFDSVSGGFGFTLLSQGCTA